MIAVFISPKGVCVLLNSGGRTMKSRVLFALLFFSCVGLLLSSMPVSATSVTSKPSSPEVSLVFVTRGSSAGKVSVSVTFSRATTHGKAPLLLTQVKVGSAICTATGRSTRCTVKNLAAGRTYRVVSRAKNRNGFGNWSSGLFVTATTGLAWSKNQSSLITTTSTTASPTSTTQVTVAPTPTTGSSSSTAPSSVSSSSTTTVSPTTTLPAVRTDLSRATLLGTSTVKLAKVSGISGSAIQAARVRASAVGDVTFKTSGIVAYAQAETQSQSGSKLLAISTTGAMSDALLGGIAFVRDFYSAPNGNVYVVFESKVALTPGGVECLLAFVDVATGVPSCVDSTLDSVRWFPDSSVSVWGKGNPPIQFDASGAVYYAGSAGSSAVLRKAKDGVITDLINDNITLQDFLVLPDGVVLVAGSTSSSQVRWLRRISVAGGLKNLAVDLGQLQSLWKFADGKAYAGLWGGTNYGLARYSTELDALEDKYWTFGNLGGIDRDAHFKFNPRDTISDCSDLNYSKNRGFCGWYGTLVSPIFNVLGQKTFGVAGAPSDGRQLWQYYPIVEKTNVAAIKSVTLAQQVITNIVLAGTSPTGSNILSLYDTSSKQETVVMDGTNEVEIYSMSYSQKKNAILFTGLRFSDNKYVVGEVSLG